MKRVHNQHGFTIIELMFATVIFSVILLMCLAALVQIGRMYYKGVTTSQTQHTVRGIMDDITQGIEFSGNDIKPPSLVVGPQVAPGGTITAGALGYFCVGSTRYTYVIDRQQTDSPSTDLTKKQIRHALWADYYPSCTTATMPPMVLPNLTIANPGGVNGRELLGANMRINALNIVNLTGTTRSTWKVNISVSYGDEDLLELDTSTTPNRMRCKGPAIGVQFCAISELTTVAKRRVL